MVGDGDFASFSNGFCEKEHLGPVNSYDMYFSSFISNANRLSWRLSQWFGTYITPQNRGITQITFYESLSAWR